MPDKSSVLFKWLNPASLGWEEGIMALGLHVMMQNYGRYIAAVKPFSPKVHPKP